MSFTTEIKKEILSDGLAGKLPMRAALGGFILTSGVVGESNGETAFFVVSETENVAEYFAMVFEELFHEPLVVSRASADKKSGRSKLVFEYFGEQREKIVKSLFLDKLQTEIPSVLSIDVDAKIAFIKGVFLGGGSCILPGESGKTGYHLEFTFPSERIAEEFCTLLDGEELFCRRIERGGYSVVYIKYKEGIADFLSVIGCQKSLAKFEKLLKKREESNQSNRAANCFSGNADKSVSAAVKQVMAIENLKKSGVLKTLDASLQKTAEIRLENPTMSMKELSELMGITKSCLNHRIRRLLSFAEKNRL